MAHQHLVANFGKAVPLGDTQHMFLVVTNRTPMATSVRTWLDTFGIEDVTRLTGRTDALMRTSGGDTTGVNMCDLTMLPIRADKI